MNMMLQGPLQPADPGLTAAESHALDLRCREIAAEMWDKWSDDASEWLLQHCDLGDVCQIAEYAVLHNMGRDTGYELMMKCEYARDRWIDYAAGLERVKDKAWDELYGERDEDE